jgi:predicted nuclease with RNAse H fold
VAVAVGVDVAEARKGLDVVALDAQRRIVASSRRATAAHVAAIVAGLDATVVCIDSPSGWAAAGERSRAAERDLRPLGISAFSTPTDPGDHPFYGWMRAGFAVYEAVAATHPLFRGAAVAGTAAEVFPEATAVLLAGRKRPKDETKVTFRRAVLDAQGVGATALRSADQVDAALAALTGVIALEGTWSALGDPAEGMLLLPVTAATTGS